MKEPVEGLSVTGEASERFASGFEVSLSRLVGSHQMRSMVVRSPDLQKRDCDMKGALRLLNICYAYLLAVQSNPGHTNQEAGKVDRYTSIICCGRAQGLLRTRK